MADGAYATVQKVLDSYTEDIGTTLVNSTEFISEQIVNTLMDAGWVHMSWGPEENRIAWKNRHHELNALRGAAQDVFDFFYRTEYGWMSCKNKDKRARTRAFDKLGRVLTFVSDTSSKEIKNEQTTSIQEIQETQERG